jgi:hypothetical protein
LKKIVVMFASGLAAAVFLLAAGPGIAFAHPSETSPCTDCHGGPSIAVTLKVTSNNGSTAVYSVSAPGASAIAVFNGSSKLSTLSGASGSISLLDARTYQVYAVEGPSTSSGIGHTSVSPVAPPVAVSDHTPPVTTSDAKPAYAGTATVHLTATDTGGSGLVHTYFMVDSGAQQSGLVISVGGIGTHALEFWSVDASGNVETPHKTASFSEVAAAPPSTITIGGSAASVLGLRPFTLTGVLSPGSLGDLCMVEARAVELLVGSRRLHDHACRRRRVVVPLRPEDEGDVLVPRGVRRGPREGAQPLADRERHDQVAHLTSVVVCGRPVRGARFVVPGSLVSGPRPRRAPRASNGYGRRRGSSRKPTCAAAIRRGLAAGGAS